MTGNEMLANLMERIATLPESSGLSFVESLNTAIQVVFLRLWSRRSDLAKKDFNQAVTVSAVQLPADFRGLAEDPFLLAGSTTYPLVPLPTGGERELAGAVGSPQYYRLTGMTLQLYPYDGVSRTMRGQYFSFPGKLALADTIPWGGVLDDLVSDAVISAARYGGMSSLLANQAFLATLDQALDGVLASRTNPAPRRAKACFF